MAVYTQIDNPEEYHNTVLFTGDGSDDRAITVGFQPNLTWMKQRTDASGGWVVDSVRGNNAALQTSNGNGEGTFADMTFTSTGITVSGNENLNNEASHNYVSWHWKAGTTSGISGSPSITPASYSFNAISGFSIIKWTGTGSAATLPHGLGVAPKMIIVKSLDTTQDWPVYHSILGNAKKFILNGTDAESASGNWNSTSPTSTLFSIGTAGQVNTRGDCYIVYCFTDVQGHSRFSSFTGNGSGTGQFTYLGFKPSFVMVKKTSGTAAAMIADNERTYPFNPIHARLMPPETTAATTGQHWIDFYSNGFTTRTDAGEDSAWNASGSTYVYAAFSEAPFCNSSGVPCNAR